MSMASIFLFGLVISIDAFSLAVCFGIKGLKFGFFDCVFINLINSLSLIISVLFAKTIFYNLSGDNLVIIGCCFLLFLGIYNIINFLLNKINKKTLNYKTRKEKSKTHETFSIIFLLCFESFISGFSALAYIENILLIILSAFVFHTLFLFFGLYFGKKIAGSENIDASWLSGIIFILLAIFKFFS